MKSTRFMFMAIAAMMAMSCIKESMPEVQDDGMYFTFEASREDLVGTKTTLVSGNKVEWGSGDKIAVFNDKGSAVGDESKDTKKFIDEDWQSSWQFIAQSAGPATTFKANSSSFDPSADRFLMVYPHDGSYYGRIEDDGTMMMRFWANPDQTAKVGTYASYVAFSVAKANSLATSVDNPIVFKNVMSLLKFTVPSELAGKITKISVTGTGSNVCLGGQLLCDYTGDEFVVTPFRNSYPGSSHAPKTEMYIKSSDGMAAGVYYLVIAPTEVETFTVTVTTKADGSYVRTTSKNKKFKSGTIYDMGEVSFSSTTYRPKPILDIAFDADGTAKDLSSNRYSISTVDGPSLMTWQNPSFGSTMARFNRAYGKDFSSGYYSFDYSSNSTFKGQLEDGFSIECLLMADFEPDGNDEIKAFSSTQSGGTSVLVANNSNGKYLAFLAHVGGGWKFCKTNVVPQRGQYYHLVGVWDKANGKGRVYLDGELKGEVNMAGAYKHSSVLSFYVGGDPGTTTAQNSWKGDVAIARVYDEVLTDEWARELSAAVQMSSATIRLDNISYMSASVVAPGGYFTVAGTGFAESDLLVVESLDGIYRKDCGCTINNSGLTATLPGDLATGTYKLYIKRVAELYPLGQTEFVVSENAAELTAPKVIAHRGYHKNGVSENSIQALAKAQELKVYGSELDVWMTTDGEVVCWHNNELTGSSTRLENQSYEEVKDFTLGNGEKLPTFEAMLGQLAQSADTKLILEFKTHSTKERNNAVVDACMQMIKDKNLTSMVEYIAFDYDVCKRVLYNDSAAFVGYLNGDKSPAEVYADGIKCIDYHYNALDKHMEWIQQAHDLGMSVNVWTVNDDADLLYWMCKGVDYITTNNPDNLNTLISTYCGSGI